MTYSSKTNIKSNNMKIFITKLRALTHITLLILLSLVLENYLKAIKKHKCNSNNKINKMYMYNHINKICIPVENTSKS